jgi:hypothetical protein
VPRFVGFGGGGGGGAVGDTIADMEEIDENDAEFGVSSTKLLFFVVVFLLNLGDLSVVAAGAAFFVLGGIVFFFKNISFYKY